MLNHPFLIRFVKGLLRVNAKSLRHDAAEPPPSRGEFQLDTSLYDDPVRTPLDPRDVQDAMTEARLLLEKWTGVKRKTAYNRAVTAYLLFRYFMISLKQDITTHPNEYEGEDYQKRMLEGFTAADIHERGVRLKRLWGDNQSHSYESLRNPHLRLGERIWVVVQCLPVLFDYSDQYDFEHIKYFKISELHQIMESQFDDDAVQYSWEEPL